MEYYSMLEEGEGGEFLRKDYCLPCWKKVLTGGKENISQKIFWKSHVPVKKQGPDLSLRRNERAFQLLKEIYQKETEEDIVQAFVLTLLLARNRMLQLRQEITQNDGQPILLYEVADTEEMLCIKKVNLSNIATDKVRQALAEKLKP